MSALGTTIAIIGILDGSMDFLETNYYQSCVARKEVLGGEACFSLWRAANVIKYTCFWFCHAPVMFKTFACFASYAFGAPATTSVAGGIFLAAATASNAPAALIWICGVKRRTAPSGDGSRGDV